MKGKKILTFDKLGKLNRFQTFSRKIEKESYIEREKIAKNIYSLYEGATISYVKGDNIHPFIPFARDSGGNLNSLLYFGKDKGDGTGEGDIVIDCGYTKFFLYMKSCGTSQYLKNIGGSLGSAQRRARIEEILNCPRLYRPERVKFTLNKDPEYFYQYPKIKCDVVYLVDATGSMKNSIENVKMHCIRIAKDLGDKIKNYDFYFGAVFYRDPVDSPNDKHQFFQLTPKVEDLQSFILGINAEGGGDGPEDWVGGYNLILNEKNGIQWRDGMKVVFHIADAGAHGKEYSDGDKHDDQGSKLDDCIRKCAKRKFYIHAFKIGDTPTKSFLRVKALYNEENNNNFSLEVFNQNNFDISNFPKKVVDYITSKVT